MDPVVDPPPLAPPQPSRAAARTPWEWAALLEEKETLARALSDQLRALTSTPQWRLADALWRARLAVIPSGSLRELWWRRIKRGAAGLAGRPPAAPGAAPRDARMPPASRATGEPGLVSVVLPVYNQAEFLPEALRSVLTQTHRDLELILVDDGSTDAIDSAVAAASADPRLRLLRQRHRGLSAALNAGFALARGEYWTWTSADNLMHPDQLAKQAAFLRGRPEAAMVYADYMAIDAAGLPLRDASWRRPNRAPDSHVVRLPRSPERLSLACDNFIGPCFLYRAGAARLIGGYDAALEGLEDYDYWLRMDSAAEIGHLGTEDVLYQYRVHGNTLSARVDMPRHLLRLEGLLEAERRRRGELEASWTIRADAGSRRWLRSIEISPHRLEAPGSRSAPRARAIHLVSPEGLRALAGKGRPSASTVVACFPRPGSASHALLANAQGAADLCFADDESDLARLALYGFDALRGAPGSALLRDALLFARHHRHGGRAEPPRAWRLPGARARVLLQGTGPGGAPPPELARGLEAEGLEPVTLRLETFRRDPRRYGEMLAELDVAAVDSHGTAFGAAQAAERGLPFLLTLGPGDPGPSAASATACLCPGGDAARRAEEELGLPLARLLLLPSRARAEGAAGAASLIRWLIQGGAPAAARALLPGSR